MANLDNILKASGLQPAEQELLEELLGVFKANEGKNEKRRLYYEDKVPTKPLGYSCPPEIVNGVNTKTGWAAKAVDMLAARSRFEGFVFEDGAPDGFNQMMMDNRIGAAYSMALPSELVHGCGFWTVERGSSADEPVAVINYHNAQSAAAVWDYRRRRIRAGFAICDYKRFGAKSQPIPSMVALYTDTAVVVITREDRTHWMAEYRWHSMGRPMMEPMVYRFREDKPFGRSRITPAVMGYVDDVQRELFNTILQSEIYSMPQKWMRNLTDEQFDAVMENRMHYYTTQVLAMTSGADGDPVDLGMFQPATMEPHLEVIDKLANLMAAETCLPVATFGVAGNGYTSSDALRASSDDLVLEANVMNARNGESLRNVAMMAMAVQSNVPMSALDDNQKSVSVCWHDTEMLTAAQATDSAIKIASVVPEYPHTEVFWERLGYSESERRRVESQIEGVDAKQALMVTLFGADNGEQEATA